MSRQGGWQVRPENYEAWHKKISAINRKNRLGKKWSPEQHRKFKATMQARKAMGLGKHGKLAPTGAFDAAAKKVLGIPHDAIILLRQAEKIALSRGRPSDAELRAMMALRLLEE